MKQAAQEASSSRVQLSLMDTTYSRLKLVLHAIKFYNAIK